MQNNQDPKFDNLVTSIQGVDFNFNGIQYTTSPQRHSARDTFSFMGTNESSESIPFTPPAFSMTHHNPLAYYHLKRKPECPDEVIVKPRKVHLNETAMSDHFAQLNLSMNSQQQKQQPTGDSVSAYDVCSFDHATHDVSEVSDDESEENKTTDSSEALLHMSDELKAHLLSHEDSNTVEKILHDLIAPKPCLALVPYDASRVPLSFLPIAEEKQHCSSSSRDTKPPVKTSYNHIDCMEESSDPEETESYLDYLAKRYRCNHEGGNSSFTRKWDFTPVTSYHHSVEGFGNIPSAALFSSPGPSQLSIQEQIYSQYSQYFFMTNMLDLDL